MTILSGLKRLCGEFINSSAPVFWHSLSILHMLYLHKILQLSSALASLKSAKRSGRNFLGVDMVSDNLTFLLILQPEIGTNFSENLI